jgi:hypothetical protein
MRVADTGRQTDAPHTLDTWTSIETCPLILGNIYVARQMHAYANCLRAHVVCSEYNSGQKFERLAWPNFACYEA